MSATRKMHLDRKNLYVQKMIEVEAIGTYNVYKI